MSEQTKIFVACLTDAKKYKAEALFDGEALVIANVLPIEDKGLFSKWKMPLIKEIQQKVEQGYIVLVEEKTDYVSRYATQYILEDLNDDSDGGSRRSNYSDALDWYFALADTGNLIIHPDYKKYSLNGSGEGSMFDRQNDDKGRSLYKVDWKRFNGGYRAMLLCVVGAMYEPLSERFLESMFEADERAHEIANPALQFKSVIQGVTLARARELEKSRDEVP